MSIKHVIISLCFSLVRRVISIGLSCVPTGAKISMSNIAATKQTHHSTLNICDKGFDMYITIKKTAKDIKLHICGVGACIPPPNVRMGRKTNKKIRLAEKLPVNNPINKNVKLVSDNSII